MHPTACEHVLDIVQNAFEAGAAETREVHGGSSGDADAEAARRPVEERAGGGGAIVSIQSLAQGRLSGQSIIS